MADEFKPGDEVRLKSGGPKMTVEDFATPIVACVWFEGTKINRGSFVFQTLVKSENEGGFSSVPIARG